MLSSFSQQEQLIFYDVAMCHHLKTCAELFEHPWVSTIFLAAPANWFSYVVDKGYCVVQCQSCVSQDDTPREGIHSEGRSNQDAT